MLPVYPFVGLLVKTSIRHFFTNIQPCYVTWLICNVQLFCSDVVQNVNVISSPICKVLCFKKHHCVSITKCFMLDTCPLAVIPSTKLPSSSILYHHHHLYHHHLQFQHHHHHHHYHHHHHHHYHKSTIVIIIFSFILLFFDIRSLCVTFIFEFICVLSNYLFFIIYWL